MASVTLRQIAQEAGVSVQTVANVLQGRNKERWASVIERANRIREIAARMDYRPNAAAKSMRTKRSGQIGILIRNNPAERFRNIMAFETILGINEELEKAGYVVSLVRIGDLRGGAETRSRVFRENLLDGMIVLSAMPPDIEQLVQQTTVRSVWVDTNHWRPQNAVRRDERHAGRLAATAAAELGYRHLLWFGHGPRDGAQAAHYSQVDRIAGARAVARARGLEFRVLKATRRTLYRSPHLLQSWLRPENAILAYSTSHARWLAHAAASLGLSPGYHFGLLCCDDSHDSTIQWPGLSRVTFDRFGMGVRAAQMMIDLLNGKRSKSTQVRGRWHAGNTAWGPQLFTPLPLPPSAVDEDEQGETADGRE